jgi:hypothetical protein
LRYHLTMTNYMYDPDLDEPSPTEPVDYSDEFEQLHQKLDTIQDERNQFSADLHHKLMQSNNSLSVSLTLSIVLNIIVILILLFR